MEIVKLKTEITESIKRDNLKESFEILFKSVKSENSFFGELISKNAHFKRINEAYRKNIIDWETMSRNKNSIIDSLLNLLDELENQINSALLLPAEIDKSKLMTNTNSLLSNNEDIQIGYNYSELVDSIIIEFTKLCDKLSTKETLTLKQVVNSNLKKFLEEKNELFLPSSSSIAGKMFTDKFSQPISGNHHSHSVIIGNYTVDRNNDFKSINIAFETLDKNMKYLEEKK